MAQHSEEELKLSTSHLRILFEALDPAGVSQASICKIYNIGGAAVSRSVQGLERDGLVTRQVDPLDNRLMRVFTTEQGKQLLEGLPQRALAFEKKLLVGWTDQEILQLHTLLTRLEDTLSKLNNKEAEASKYK
jgi:DNA-binding MarR family transcriptional regulator